MHLKTTLLKCQLCIDVTTRSSVDSLGAAGVILPAGYMQVDTVAHAQRLRDVNALI